MVSMKDVLKGRGPLLRFSVQFSHGRLLFVSYASCYRLGPVTIVEVRLPDSVARRRGWFILIPAHRSRSRYTTCVGLDTTVHDLGFDPLVTSCKVPRSRRLSSRDSRVANCSMPRAYRVLLRPDEIAFAANLRTLFATRCGWISFIAIVTASRASP